MSDARDHLESIDQPTVHHEETDVNIRAIFGFGARAARGRASSSTSRSGGSSGTSTTARRVEHGPASPLATGRGAPAAGTAAPG